MSRLKSSLDEWNQKKFESNLGKWLLVIWYGFLTYSIAISLHFWLFHGGPQDESYRNLFETHGRVVNGLEGAPFQYRILSYLIPELVHRVLGVSISQAYGAFRWGTLWLAATAFHAYLRVWFDWRYSMIGTLLVLVMLPFQTILRDLQPTDFPAFLFIALAFFLLATQRSHWLILLAPIAVLFRETGLHILVAWALVVPIAEYPRRELIKFVIGMLTTLAAFLGVRVYYGYRDYWTQLFTLFINVRNVSNYLATFVSFNLLWIFAILGFRHSPRFLRHTIWLVIPVTLSVWLIGRPLEARLWLPLAPAIVPMALMYIRHNAIAASHQ